MQKDKAIKNGKNLKIQVSQGRTLYSSARFPMETPSIGNYSWEAFEKKKKKTVAGEAF